MKKMVITAVSFLPLLVNGFADLLPPFSYDKVVKTPVAEKFIANQAKGFEADKVSLKGDFDSAVSKVVVDQPVKANK